MVKILKHVERVAKKQDVCGDDETSDGNTETEEEAANPIHEQNREAESIEKKRSKSSKLDENIENQAPECGLENSEDGAKKVEDDVENEVAEPAATSNHKRESSLRNAENKVAESPEKKVPEPVALEKLEEKVPESLGNSPKLVLGREGLGADGLSDKEPCCLPSPRRNQKAANLENKRIEPFSPVPTYNITQSREEEATVKETEVETENLI